MTRPTSAQVAAKFFNDSRQKEFKDARPGGSSTWLGEGHYLCQIQAIKMQENRKGEAAFMVEMTVVHVYNDADAKGHRAGEDVTHAMWTKHDSFYGNVKQFIGATLQVPPAEVEQSAVTDVLAEDQPMAGMIIEVTGRGITTRGGNPFTKIVYKGEASPEQIKRDMTPEAIARFEIEA